MSTNARGKPYFSSLLAFRPPRDCPRRAEQLWKACLGLSQGAQSLPGSSPGPGKACSGPGRPWMSSGRLAQRCSGRWRATHKLARTWQKLAQGRLGLPRSSGRPAQSCSGRPRATQKFARSYPGASQKLPKSSPGSFRLEQPGFATRWLQQVSAQLCDHRHFAEKHANTLSSPLSTSLPNVSSCDGCREANLDIHTASMRVHVCACIHVRSLWLFFFWKGVKACSKSCSVMS